MLSQWNRVLHVLHCKMNIMMYFCFNFWTSRLYSFWSILNSFNESNALSMLKFLHVTFLKGTDLCEQQTDMMSVFVAGYSGETLLL